MVNHYFIYGGVKSIDMGMKIEKADIFSSPSPRVTVQQIPGRSGDLILPDGSFENVNISYDCFFKSDTPDWLPYQASKIKSWLLSNYGEYQEIEDTYDPDYYREGYFKGPATIERKGKRYAKIKAEFSCKPYKYRKDGTQLIQVFNGNYLLNPEASNSQPYIKIVGNGSAVLTIGSQSWEFKDIDEYLEIDCETKNVYKEYESQNNKMSGEYFPELHPEKNNITWNGGISKIYIKPRWRTL